MSLSGVILVHVVDCHEHEHISLICFLLLHKISKNTNLVFSVFSDLGFNLRGFGSISSEVRAMVGPSSLHILNESC